MMNYRLHTPEGVKDYLPQEYAIKKQTENNVMASFERYGYAAIDTPTFEFIQVLDGMGGVSDKRMYKLLDRDGSILGLRSDFTPAIARIASTAYTQENVPMRFSYIGNCFRYNENYQGKLREFTQAGVELIGVDSVEADTEILIAAINSLLAAGLKDFRIDIGNVTFLQGVLEEAGLSADMAEKIRESIIDKNYTAVGAMVQQLEMSDSLKKIFEDLPLLIGDIEMLEMLKDSVKNEKSLNALARLQEIYNLLAQLQLESYISFDFSVMGHLDYYTGLVFRGYARGTGFSIADGGRYDNLVKNFGADYPAVGFVVKINELIAALSNQSVADSENNTVFIAYTAKSRVNAFAFAEKIRKKGQNAVVAITEGSYADKKEIAIKNSYSVLYYFDEKVKVFVAENNEEKEIDISLL